MEEENNKGKKCFSKDHSNIDAVNYCPNCRLYMCNKCEKIHSDFLKDNHKIYKLENDINEIFTGFCKKENHPNKLEYYCKNHNELCCANCICKLKDKVNGQHKDCDVVSIENIKEEKKNKLVENIKSLEELENKFNETLKDLRNLFDKIEKDKEELKLEVQKIFTKIRKALNDREDKLLLDIDNIYNNKFMNEDLINKGEKLPKKIKLSLEKGKLINKEWDNNNLNSYINDCINIENNIEIINEINESINKSKNNEKLRIKFEPKEESLNYFLDTINNLGNIYDTKYSFKECPNNIKEGRKYILIGEKKNILKSISCSWNGTICENELNKSIEEHTWKIKILKTQHKYTMVGVAPIDFDINSSDYSTCGWYFYCYDSTLFSGPPYKYSNKNSGLNKVNDEIVIKMNMKKRTLKFIINNEDKGDSYINIPIDKPIFPTVLLCQPDDSVEITEC